MTLGTPPAPASRRRVALGEDAARCRRRGAGRSRGRGAASVSRRAIARRIMEAGRRPRHGPRSTAAPRSCHRRHPRGDRRDESGILDVSSANGPLLACDRSMLSLSEAISISASPAFTGAPTFDVQLDDFHLFAGLGVGDLDLVAHLLSLPGGLAERRDDVVDPGGAGLGQRHRGRHVDERRGDPPGLRLQLPEALLDGERQDLGGEAEGRGRVLGDDESAGAADRLGDRRTVERRQRCAGRRPRPRSPRRRPARRPRARGRPGGRSRPG